MRALAPIGVALALSLPVPGSADRLADAVAAHPDDRDLSFAYARALFERGDTDRAVSRLSRHLARWPDHPPDGASVLGSWLHALGRDAEAVALLEDALARSESAAGRLTLGLALRRLGRVAEAVPQLERAAALSDALAGEALLLAGLDRISLGDAQAGDALLERVVALDPDAEAGRSARLVLEGTAHRDGGRLRVEAWSGIGFDSNVTLESDDTTFAGAGSDETDLQVGFGALARVRVLSGERTRVEIGSRYDGGRQLDQHDYDSDRFHGFLSAHHALGERLALRLDAWGGHSRLDDAPHLTSVTLRPTLLATLSERVGVFGLFAEGEWLDYDEDPLLPAFERDGFSYGGGLVHHVPIPVGEDRAWLSVSGGFARRVTEADRDPLLGFAGDYDHDRWRARLRSHWPLPLRLRAVAELGFDAERYVNENLTGLLTELDDAARSDEVWTAALTLTRPLGRLLDLELAYRFTDRASNVALFSYDRHVVGFLLRAHTP